MLTPLLQLGSRGCRQAGRELLGCFISCQHGSALLVSLVLLVRDISGQ